MDWLLVFSFAVDWMPVLRNPLARGLPALDFLPSMVIESSRHQFPMGRSSSVFGVWVVWYAEKRSIRARKGDPAGGKKARIEEEEEGRIDLEEWERE